METLSICLDVAIIVLDIVIITLIIKKWREKTKE